MSEGARPPRGARTVQRLLVLGIAVAGLALGAIELHDRARHVTETDARVAADLVTVSSRVAGRVTEVAVREGVPVGRGAVIARLDDRDARLLASELAQGIARARSEQERLRAERELAERQIESRTETQRTRLRAAQASLSVLEAERELARGELARARSLREKRVIAQARLDEARTAVRKVEGEYRMALAEVEESRAGLGELQAERIRLQVLDRRIEALGHEIARLQSQLERQTIDVEDRVVRSPIQGVVDRLFVEAGEYVTPGERIAVVHDPRAVWVEANVKETEIGRLAVGQPVEISVDAFPDLAVRGRVESIGGATTASFALLPDPNPSGNFTKITQRLPVRIALEGVEPGRLRPGMMVEVRIAVGDRRRSP